MVCAIARVPETSAECPPQEMQDADALGPALLAHVDEFIRSALGPGRHHAPVVEPDRAETVPMSGIAPDHPVFDQLADGQLVEQQLVHVSPLKFLSSEEPLRGTL